MSGASFEDISRIVTEIYQETLGITTGQVANYIPQLANVNPNLYGISVCSVTGEMFHIGDTEQEFCIQSCCKPLNYCLARTTSTSEVHSHVGYEPSGRAFNSFVLNERGLPHNPLINSGAIMTTSIGL